MYNKGREFLNIDAGIVYSDVSKWKYKIWLKLS